MNVSNNILSALENITVRSEGNKSNKKVVTYTASLSPQLHQLIKKVFGKSNYLREFFKSKRTSKKIELYEQNCWKRKRFLLQNLKLNVFFATGKVISYEFLFQDWIRSKRSIFIIAVTEYEDRY